MKNIYVQKQGDVKLINSLTTQDIFTVDVDRKVLFNGSIEIDLILRFQTKNIVLGTYCQGQWLITLDGYANDYLTFSDCIREYGSLIQRKMNRELSKPVQAKPDLGRVFNILLYRFKRQWKNSH